MLPLHVTQKIRLASKLYRGPIANDSVLEIREGRIATAECSRAHTVKKAGDDWIRGCFLKSFLKLRRARRLLGYTEPSTASGLRGSLLTQREPLT